MFNSVLLDTGHPDYDANQQKSLGWQSSSPEDMAAMYPAPKFRIVEGQVEPNYVQTSTLDQLKAIFSTLDEDTQADLGPLAAAVFMYLDHGNPAVAKRVVERAQIPAELEPLRKEMLGRFP